MPFRAPIFRTSAAIKRTNEAQQQHSRDSAAIYDRQWRQLRKDVLASEPLCRDCRAKDQITEATMVHHHYPVDKYPGLRLTREHLVPLCDRCHALRHSRNSHP